MTNKPLDLVRGGRRIGVEERRFTDCGFPFSVLRWEMPRIEERLLDAVAYLYENKKDADTGSNSGGSGFLVGVESQTSPRWSYIYCVSCWHVVEGTSSTRPAPVVRLRSQAGDTKTFALSKKEWFPDQTGEDLAVGYLGPFEMSVFPFVSLTRDVFLTEELIEQHDIGAGDDVFMLGRLVAYDGGKTNRPAARFGSISKMPSDPILNPRGGKLPAVLVEMHSVSGFSGSAVYVHILQGGPRPKHRRKDNWVLTQTAEGPWLLGVDYGFTRRCEPVRDGTTDEKEAVTPARVVLVNSGQSGVTPAWKLRQLLDHPELMTRRAKADKARARERAESPMEPASASEKKRRATKPRPSSDPNVAAFDVVRRLTDPAKVRTPPKRRPPRPATKD